MYLPDSMLDGIEQLMIDRGGIEIISARARMKASPWRWARFWSANDR